MFPAYLRSGHDQVGCEHGNSRDRFRIVRCDQRSVGCARCFNPTGTAGRSKTFRCSHAHGTSPIVVSPVISGHPFTMLNA